MLLPAVQYGPSPDVKRRMQRVVDRLVRGEGLIEVMTADGMIDVMGHPGLLLWNGVTRGSEPNFHVGLPWLPLWQALIDRRRRKPANVDPRVSDAVFDASLSVPWGVLGLLSYDNWPWVAPRTRFEPFLAAVVRYWDELESVGPRYYAAVQGARLWSVGNTLQYVLANLGVPTELLRAPLPPDGPRGLLRYARPAEASTAN